MKRALNALTILILLTSWAVAQESGEKGHSKAGHSADQGLQKRFREYSDALTKRDTATLDKIWAPDYTFINPQGVVVTKAERMTNIKSTATQFKAIAPQQEKVTVHGDVAIDIGTVTLEGTKYAGQESSGEYRYMNVWRNVDGQWQMLANQITLIKK
jgi:ketosteroid isomerase-like protein